MVAYVMFIYPVFPCCSCLVRTPHAVGLFTVINFQSVVLRDGSWQKINFERNVPVLDSTADSQVVLRSPWIRHFTSSGKRRCVRSPN